jgi:hypothetical protein
VLEGQRSSHSLLTREVNDRVYELLSENGSVDGEFPCECSDASCLETIPLTLREYAARRAQPERPLLKLSGHPD